MLYIFAIYMAVTLATGSALLLVWRQDRSQAFTALLGGSHLVWTLNPLAYLASQRPEVAWRLVGLIGLVMVGGTYISLLTLGFSHLSGRRFKLRKLALAAVLLLGLHGGLLIGGGMQAAQLGFACLNTVVGLMVGWWLRGQGIGERMCGVFIVLCGLNQFTYALMGDSGALLQTAVAAVLRLLLGMSLMYAALNRSGLAVKRMRDRFFELTERSPQGVAVVRAGMVAYANPAFRQLYGMGDDPSGHPPVFSPAWIEATVPERERDAAEAIGRRVREGEVPQAEWSGERWSLDRRRLQLRFRAWRVEWDGAPALQVVVTDDTARFDATQALLWRATHDELTGLPNRSALLQALRDLFEEPERPPFALILIDVDRFKLFNEAHGQDVGDQVLQALSKLLVDRLSRRAEVMRMGEDEFALLIRSADAVGVAEQLTQEVKDLLREPLALTEHRFFLDVSMGVASCPSSARTAEALLQAAHAAMHEAKRLPGTSAQWATETGAQGLVSFFSAEQALRAGLQNDEFKLVYQPKVDARTGGLLGFEALVRWDRPGVGRVNPMDFIPAAERNGLIVPLGALILREACCQLAAWRDLGLQVAPVAVNVSPLQLLDADFPAAVMRTLREFDLPPAWITLEITETAAVTHMEQASGQISQLRQAGVEVALDDFGTGFSSLNMLRSLPLRTVKIDRSLIDPMPNQEANAVVKAICDLASVLSLDVVAEGVETQAHAAAALHAGCDALQGFFFAKPLEVDDATRWLTERY